MTPIRDHDTPDDQPPRPDPTDPHTAPIPLPRRPRDARPRSLRLALRYPRPTRPASVWPCADDELRDGTGLIAQWLLTAVIKIVTTYTAPGQRVLLLTPSPGIASPSGWPATAGVNRPRHRPYAGLLEAAWTVVRLGRGIQTQTAAAHSDGFAETGADPSPQSESGPGPRTCSPSTDYPDRGGAAAQSGPDTAPTGPGPDRFDLIITAAEPGILDALAPTAWADMLTPTGTLAVVTHGDNSGGWLADPAGPLVRAAHDAGLRFIDRIALLRVPVQDTVLAIANPAAHTREQSPPGPPTAAIRHAQVHDDLFVFARQPGTAPAASNAVDGTETSGD